MVPPFAKPSLITTSLLVALFLSCVFPCCSARIVNVNDICSKHIHPSNCNELLYNIPGISSGVSLGVFAPLTLSLNSVNVYEGLNLVSYLMDKATDPQWKQRYTKCYLDYSRALMNVKKAKLSFKSTDYAVMNSHIGNVVVHVKDCSEFTVGDPSTLPSFNSYLEDMSIISQILADYLAGKH